jgi:hypothetical protein
MKNIVPHGNMVLLSFEKVIGADDFLKKQGSLLIKNEADGKSKYRAKVSAIGEGIDTTKISWKIGDFVIYNDYDIKTLSPPGDSDTVFGLAKVDSIWATYEE